MRLQDRVAIITGAGGGIGYAYAERFLAEGAKVVLAEIGPEQGSKAAETLADQGEVIYVHTDIADEASSAACVDAAVEAFGTVDILLNNAAIYGELDLGNNSLEYLRQVFDVNVHGQWLMARAAAKVMVPAGYGRIINVASIAGYLSGLGRFTAAPADDFELSSFAYAHSKFSVIGLSRHMAGQLGQFGVTVNTIAPGLVMTPATDKQVPAGFDSIFADMSASGRNTDPEHMTGAAVFFATEEAGLVNGQVLCIDGGNVMPV